MLLTRRFVEVLTAFGTGLFGFVGLAGAVELGYGWGQSGPESGYFPFWISLVLIGASLWNLAGAVRGHLSARRVALAAAVRADMGAVTGVGTGVEIVPSPDDAPFLSAASARRIAVFLAEMVAFVILTLVMGVYVGCTVYIGWSAWKHGGYRPLTSLAIGVIFSVAQYVLFEIIFLVPLLKGPIEAALGIY